MIEFVKTKHGLIRKDVAEQLEAVENRRKKRADRAFRAQFIARARLQGFTEEQIQAALKQDPKEAVRQTFEKIRDEIGPDELLRRFPCRGCKVAHDERYRAVCAEMKQVPCFLKAAMRGCPDFQPKAIVG